MRLGPTSLISPLLGALAHALAHVDLAHLHPDGVVHDAVHDRLGLHAASMVDRLIHGSVRIDLGDVNVRKLLAEGK